MDGSPLTDLDAIRAEIAALWAACQQLNANQRALLDNIYRLSHRLAIQESATVIEEMQEPRRLQ